MKLFIPWDLYVYTKCLTKSLGLLQFNFFLNISACYLSNPNFTLNFLVILHSFLFILLSSTIDCLNYSKYISLANSLYFGKSITSIFLNIPLSL